MKILQIEAPPRRASSFRARQRTAALMASGSCVWALLQFSPTRLYYRSVYDLFNSLRRNWDVALAVVLAYTAIAICLGPAYFFAAWFLNGCAYIIHTALRR